MAKSQEIKIGPWPRGINLLDKPDRIDDEAAAWILNFDVDNSGVLVPRRNLEFSKSGVANVTKYLLGPAVLDGESQTRVLVGSIEPAGTRIFALDNPRNSSDAEIPPLEFANVYPGTYKSVVHYQNKLWYIPGVSSSLGRSSPASTANVSTAVSTIPFGEYGFVLKDRMFVVRKATSELYFSKATDFTNWIAPDGGIIRVNPGDNRPITKVVVLNSQIVIFKRDETYVLSFTNSPTGDGVLRQVSPDQGAIDAITYNNEIYCFNARSVFKFVNGFFQDIGTQLNFSEIARFDRGTIEQAGKIHIVGNTLIVGLSVGDRAAAMNLNSGSWSLYEVHSKFAGVYSGASVSGRGSTNGRFVVFGDGRTELYSMFVERGISAGVPDHASDNIPRSTAYELFTKVYDLNDSQVWKRLFAWFADLEYPVLAKFGQLGFVRNDRTVEFDGRPDNTDTYINSVGGLVGPSTSVRFQTLQFVFKGVTVPTVTANRTKLAPTIRYIKAKIGVKANVSKTVASV